MAVDSSAPVVYTESDRQERREGKKLRARLAVKQAQRNDFVRAALGTPQGREYFYWLMSLGRVGANPYTNNALSTSFQCGELNVSQKILENLITVSPEGYLNILKEQEAERVANARDTSNADTDTDSDAGASDANP